MLSVDVEKKYAIKLSDLTQRILINMRKLPFTPMFPGKWLV